MAHSSTRRRFPRFGGGKYPGSFHANAAVLTEEDLVEVDENSDANVDIPHLITALKRGFRWWIT